MDKELFRNRFIEAADIALEKGQKFIFEELSEEICFDLKLNDSYDVGASLIFRLYPEDSFKTMAESVIGLTVEQTVDTLWREGFIPCWVDLYIKATRKNRTIIELSVCGQFTDQESLLYHIEEGRPPFHVLGPSMPSCASREALFSIHWNKYCRTASEFADALENDEKVISLKLNMENIGQGQEDDRSHFPNPTLLTIENPVLEKQRLQSLGVPASVKSLTLNFGKTEQFDLNGLSYFQGLESLTIIQAPARMTGLEEARSVLENLTDFSLSAETPVYADGILTFKDQAMFYLDLPVFPDWIAGCKGGKYLIISCSDGSEKNVMSFLEKSLSSMEDLSLKSTPVTDDIFNILMEAHQLSTVDFTQTLVSMKAINAFEKQRPRVLCQPQYFLGTDGQLLSRKEMQ